MSLATEATLYVTSADPEFCEAAQEAVETHKGDQGFTRIATEVPHEEHDFKVDAAGGFNYYTGAVFAACFDFVTPHDVIDFCAKLPWGHREGVLVINHEYQERDGSTPLVIAHFPLGAPKPQAYR